jgi:hypothetical protein
MAVLRLVFGLLLLAALVCFAMYIGTRAPVWRMRGVRLLTWTLIAAVVFFGVLAVERLVPLLRG